MNQNKWCEHCNAAQDTAKLWKIKCKPNHRHKFTLTSPKGYPEYSHRGWKIKHGWNAKGHMG